ncbi:unnamed protein product [marine sediment metagenome]|uniref:Uncharacterized protein n=1 Tax=marine sediment metagenome TaxID=412755 RepID=X1DC85_9ZZZZ
MNIGEGFQRIQETINAWAEAIKLDDTFYPQKWACEQLWMDVEILKAAVYLQLQTTSSSFVDDEQV